MSAILAVPFIAWFIGGSTKFFVNCMKTKSLAFKKIGYGGLPSNHATIVSATASYLVFAEPDHPQLALIAVTLGFIVCMDAMGLRKHVQKQARLLKDLAEKNNLNSENIRLTLAHTPLEVFSGIILGAIIGYTIFKLNF